MNKKEILICLAVSAGIVCLLKFLAYAILNYGKV